MRKINLDKLKSEDLKDGEALIEAYKVYLKKKLKYSEWEADMASSDLENPYNTPYIMQDYEQSVEIDGVCYEIRSCHTDFCVCGLFELANAKPFEFYMLFDMSTVPNRTVGEYSGARKMYVF